MYDHLKLSIWHGWNVLHSKRMKEMMSSILVSAYCIVIGLLSLPKVDICLVQKLASQLNLIFNGVQASESISGSSNCCIWRAIWQMNYRSNLMITETPSYKYCMQFWQWNWNSFCTVSIFKFVRAWLRRTLRDLNAAAKRGEAALN